MAKKNSTKVRSISPKKPTSPGKNFLLTVSLVPLVIGTVLLGAWVLDIEILPDPHGIRTWDPLNFGRVCVHIVDGAMFREITGRELPPSPIQASDYA